MSMQDEGWMIFAALAVVGAFCGAVTGDIRFIFPVTALVVTAWCMSVDWRAGRRP